jgi:hypothetical protein
MPASDHVDFARPDASTRIWRYMDLAQYVSMLQTEGLWLSRVDLLGDPFEGCHTLPDVQAWQAALATTGMPPEALAKALVSMQQSSLKILSIMYVNCWHMNEVESDAMWKAYGASENGIAVVTTCSTLVAQLDEGCFVGTVAYIDYERDTVGRGTVFRRILHKRRSFVHEQELRICRFIALKDYPNSLTSSPSGLLQKVRLQDLVQEVYVAPQAPTWYRETVESVTNRWGYGFPVHHSRLDAVPISF